MRLELKGISKSFGSNKANDSIDLKVAPGEIHAVLGENGAGKSTLMKMIYGVYAPDAGEMYWDGKRVDIASPVQAQALGIAMVHQHFALFDALTVAENISLGLTGRHRLSDLSKQVREVSELYGLPLNPDQHMFTMSVGERQRVEIIRCLLQKPRLLIMDEPTSVLTPQAVQRLFATLRQLSSEGCSILYISHKLEEVRELCQGATVLRRGAYAGSVVPADVSARDIAELMIGGDLPTVKAQANQTGEPALVIRNLSRPKPNPFGTALNHIGLTVRAGEVIGIAGVSGNGQQEFLRAISGETQADTHEAAECIEVLQQSVGQRDPGQRRAAGLGFVPEERLGRGAIPAMSLTMNAVLTGWRHGMINGLKMIDRKASRVFAQQCIERFDVRTQGPESAAQSLSGGNLQKFIVGREIMLAPRMMVLAQPTWGVDVGAASVIRQRIRDLASDGIAVLVVSEELDELFEVSDRMAVMYQGHLSPLVDIAQTSADEIGLWMAGLWPNGPGHEERQRQLADTPNQNEATLPATRAT